MIEDKQDETVYLLSSDKMRERILAARESSIGIPVEVVRETLGTSVFTPLNQELAASQLQQFIDQQ